MKTLIYMLLALALLSSKAYASFCYCVEWDNIVLKVRVASYEGVFAANPAIAADGTIYINVTESTGGTYGKLIARSPDRVETVLLTDVLPNVSPVIAPDGTLYLAVVSETDRSRSVMVALAPDGSELWRYEGINGWMFNGPSIAADGTLIVTTFNENIYAISPQGELLWTTSYPSFAFSPTVIGPSGNLYIPTMNDDETNSLLAYSSKGDALWSKEFPFRVFSGIAIGEDGALYFGADGLYAFNSDGDELWKAGLGDYDFTGITGPPTVDGFGNIYAGYQAANNGDQELLYSGMASFAADGTLRWSYALENGEIILTSPIITADGVAIFASDSGLIYKLSAEDGTLVTAPFSAEIVTDVYGISISNEGNLIVNGDGGLIIWMDWLELATSPWPKYMRDNRNSSSAASTAGGNTPQIYKAADDVDGDGKSDLLWRSYDKGWNFLWSMAGTEILSATPINVVASPDWDMVATGDYDADGFSDIFWRNQSTGQNFVYLMNGSSINTRYSLNYVTAGEWIVAGSGDFDGDGSADILWRNVMRGDTWFYLMSDGVIQDSISSLWVTDLNYEISTIADIDGDGDDDVIWRHSQSGINYIWEMENGAISSRYILNTVNTDWNIVGAGDLDGDGTDDIILRNKINGQNWAYFMDNGRLRESVLINTVADLNWEIANIGDYDGDGKADLLWRNSAAGRNIIHLMDGATIKARGVLRATDDTWKVAR